MEQIVIWGASGHAMVVADIIRLRGEYQLAGFLDSLNPQRHHTLFDGAEILGGEDQLEELRESGIKHLIVGFGNCEALSLELLSRPAYPPATFLLPVTSHVEQEIVFVDRERGELKVRGCSPPRSSPENNSTV